MRNICVVGTGYVGLTTGTCFADLGNNVVCLDVDAAKIAALLQGQMPIYEPGLSEMVKRNVDAGRLRFTTDYAEGMKSAEFVFIAVGTPTRDNSDHADLRYVRSAARSIAEHISSPVTIINKSTVPIGTGDWVASIVGQSCPDGALFSVVSNPEFLREGVAILDFMQPDRVVLGSEDRSAAERVASLYLALKSPIIITDLRTAEMIKYASNAFLATRISFINEMARICERLGADVKQVAVGMGYDKRIGPAFLDAGLGFGGSCFPKDVRALAYMADQSGCHPQMLRAVLEINADQRTSVLDKLREALGGSLVGRRVALLGLAFKENTDDMREAPSIDIAQGALAEGAQVVAYDPVATMTARPILPDVVFATSPYEAVQDADAVVVVTSWNEFKSLDMTRLAGSMRQKVMIDGRNLYMPEAMRALGFTYLGVGRGYAPQVLIDDDTQDLTAVPLASLTHA